MPLFGKSEDQKAAEAQHMELLHGMSDGTVELDGLGGKLSSTAQAAGIKQGKEAKLVDQAFRGLVERVLDELRKLQTQLAAGCDRRAQEARNIVNCAVLVARSALEREESRGAHYRLDFPVHEDGRFKKHSVVSGDNIRFE